MDQPGSLYALFSAHLPVSQTAKFGGAVVKTAFTLDIVLMSGALPKPPSWFEDVLEGPTELSESCSTHSYGVLQEKETD